MTSRCSGFSCCTAQALGHVGFSRCGSWALEHRLNSCGTLGLAAPQDMKSSQLRIGTCISCIGRWILYRWATREAPAFSFWDYLRLWVPGKGEKAKRQSQDWLSSYIYSISLATRPINVPAHFRVLPEYGKDVTPTPIGQKECLGLGVTISFTIVDSNALL